MNYSAILEVLTSLTIQVTLLIGVTASIARRPRFAAKADVCWSTLHVCILLLTLAALFFPHLRFLTWADFQPTQPHLRVAAITGFVGRLAIWAWMSGTTVILLACVVGIVRATSIVRRAVVDPMMGQLPAAESERSGRRGEEAETRVIADNLSPFCWQLHHPVIVLPEVVREFPHGEQAAILRHEQTHLELQHPLHLFLQRLVEAIYWFHPLVWWASQQAAAARELRCDRDSVRTKSEVVEYLRSLLRLVEAKMKSPAGLPTGIGFMGNNSLLARRAQQLGSFQEQEAPTPQPRRAATIIVCCTVLCGMLWLPINPYASRRSVWSPWPTWSAQALGLIGIVVRDYEVDGHRLTLPSQKR